MAAAQLALLTAVNAIAGNTLSHPPSLSKKWSQTKTFPAIADKQFTGKTKFFESSFGVGAGDERFNLISSFFPMFASAPTQRRLNYTMLHARSVKLDGT